MFHFNTPRKRQKIFGFLTFAGVIEIEHWSKMGEHILQFNTGKHWNKLARASARVCVYIYVCVCMCQEVSNVSFSEKFAYVLNP